MAEVHRGDQSQIACLAQPEQSGLGRNFDARARTGCPCRSRYLERSQHGSQAGCTVVCTGPAARIPAEAHKPPTRLLAREALRATANRVRLRRASFSSCSDAFDRRCRCLGPRCWASVARAGGLRPGQDRRVRGLRQTRAAVTLEVGGSSGSSGDNGGPSGEALATKPHVDCGPAAQITPPPLPLRLADEDRQLPHSVAGVSTRLSDSVVPRPPPAGEACVVAPAFAGDRQESRWFGCPNRACVQTMTASSPSK